MNTAFFVLAAGLGLASSLHCVGMCTPLQAALRSWLGLGPGSIALYHTARITAYASLGALAGLAGKALQQLAFQQWVAWGGAAFIVLVAVFHVAGRSLFRAQVPLRVQRWLGKGLARLQRNKNRWGVVAGLGLANGFLPCGMVYLALVGTLAVPGAGPSALYMLLFGLGTIPALLGSQWLIARLQLRRLPWALVALVVAALLVYRASSLSNTAGTGATCATPVADMPVATQPVQ